MDIIKVIISFIDNFKSINVANIIAFVLNNCPGNLKMLASTSERKNNNPIKILLE
jgi:hypothetical protein